VRIYILCRIINEFFYFIVFFILWILLDLRLTIFKNRCNLISFILYPEENLLSWLVYLFRLAVLLFLQVLRMLDQIHMAIVYAGFLGSRILLLGFDFLAESSARFENLQLILMILFILLNVFLFLGFVNFFHVTWDFMKVLILIFIMFFHLLSDFYLVLVYSLGI